MAPLILRVTVFVAMGRFMAATRGEAARCGLECVLLIGMWQGSETKVGFVGLGCMDPGITL